MNRGLVTRPRVGSLLQMTKSKVFLLAPRSYLLKAQHVEPLSAAAEWHRPVRKSLRWRALIPRLRYRTTPRFGKSPRLRDPAPRSVLDATLVTIRRSKLNAASAARWDRRRAN